MESSTMKHFTLVARAESAAFFPDGVALKLPNIKTTIGQVELIMATRRDPTAGFSKPLQRGLFAQVRGPASDLPTALTEFSSLAQAYCPFITLVTNATTKNMVPELCIECTAGITERDFFQQSIPEERIFYVQRRRVQIDVLYAVLLAMNSHPESDRIHRALAHYHRALQEWGPGEEIVATEHLWMAMECLTPVALRINPMTAGKSREVLAREWEVDRKDVDAEIRRRILCNGDDSVYDTTKRASDGFEHGYLDLPQIHQQFFAVKERLAAYVRKAIIDVIGIDASNKHALLSEPYVAPFDLRIDKYLRGKLVGPPGDLVSLAAPQEAFPRVQWSTKFEENKNESSDEITFLVTDNIRKIFAAGVDLQDATMELWGSKGISSGIKVK